MIECADYDPLRGPVGSEMVPERPEMAPETLLGPFLAYFGPFIGPRPKIFLSPFWAKIGQIFFSKNFFIGIILTPKRWGPVGSEMVPEWPKVAPETLLGPFWPILVHFLGQNRPKKFSKKKIFALF